MPRIAVGGMGGIHGGATPDAGIQAFGAVRPREGCLGA